jgi:peptidyl-prolyl cis-trans isomerase SDCCAG10
MLKLGEGEIIGETPVHKHKIIKTEIITNPFDNMVARSRSKTQTMDEDEENKKSKQTVSAKAIKNYGLLSFGNEAEEDEEEITKISMKFKQKGTGKSAHDLTNDSTLSKSIVRLDQNDEESDEELPIEKDIPKPKEKSDADFDQEELDRVRQKFNAKKLAKQDKKKVLALDIDDDEEQNSSTTSKSNDNVKLEIERLKKELKQSKKASVLIKSSEDIVPEETEPAPPPPPLLPVTADTSVLMDELMSGTRRKNKKQHISHSNSRESQTLELLSKFQAKLHAAKDNPIAEPTNETKLEQIADTVDDQFLQHRFISEALLDNVQDIYTNADLLTVYDPRNPMTKRRRDESSTLLHQKKQKGRT